MAASERIVLTRVPPGNTKTALEAFASTWTWHGPGPIPRAELLARAETATGLYTMLTDIVDEALLDQAPLLRVVSQMAVGVDNIDLAACQARGIAVGHTPDVLTESTADLAFGLIIAGARRFREGSADVAAGRWGDWEPDYLLGHDVHASTLGIVGFGRIGQAIARRAAGFSVRVLYTQRNRNPSAEASLDAEYVQLDSLLKQADHVVIATPLSAETTHLIGESELAMMKTTASLINIARGPIVDSLALADALESGIIGGAAIDVTDPEPLPPDHRLAALENCLILPHIGSSTVRTRTAMADLATDNLICGLRGTPMPARVS